MFVDLISVSEAHVYVYHRCGDTSDRYLLKAFLNGNIWVYLIWVTMGLGYVNTNKTSYRKTSSISRTKSQSLNVSCIL